MTVLLTETPFDPAALLDEFSKSAINAGAIVSFSGIVRPHAKDGAVTGLHLQAYSPMTERGIEAAAEQAKQRWPLENVYIVHRTGDMQAGEPIVFVATASAHRRAAFEAADFLMDYLKTEAIFWKKEYTETDARWIEPRPEDYADKQRWTRQET